MTTPAEYASAVEEVFGARLEGKDPASRLRVLRKLAQTLSAESVEHSNNALAMSADDSSAALAEATRAVVKAELAGRIFEEVLDA